ncbi:MAG: hypothetical protein R6X02_12745 [Enhygromyxa sp.]
MADEHSDQGDEAGDPDRAAILARRRRFIALAISGLATAGCKVPEGVHACLSPELDPEPKHDDEGEPLGLDGPFVEDPGAPLSTGEGDETGGDESEGDETGEALEQTPPEVCLKVAPAPRPCLKKRPAPKVCLMIID